MLRLFTLVAVLLSLTAISACGKGSTIPSSASLGSLQERSTSSVGASWYMFGSDANGSRANSNTSFNFNSLTYLPCGAESGYLQANEHQYGSSIIDDAGWTWTLSSRGRLYKRDTKITQFRSAYPDLSIPTEIDTNYSTPAFSSSYGGRVYVHRKAGLFAYDTNGALKWTHQDMATSNTIFTSPVVTSFTFQATPTGGEITEEWIVYCKETGSTTTVYAIKDNGGSNFTVRRSASIPGNQTERIIRTTPVVADTFALAGIKRQFIYFMAVETGLPSDTQGTLYRVDMRPALPGVDTVNKATVSFQNLFKFCPVASPLVFTDPDAGRPYVVMTGNEGIGIWDEALDLVDQYHSTGWNACTSPSFMDVSDSNFEGLCAVYGASNKSSPIGSDPSNQFRLFAVVLNDATPTLEPCDLLWRSNEIEGSQLSSSLAVDANNIVYAAADQRVYCFAPVLDLVTDDSDPFCASSVFIQQYKAAPAKMSGLTGISIHLANGFPIVLASSSYGGNYYFVSVGSEFGNPDYTWPTFMSQGSRDGRSISFGPGNIDLDDTTQITETNDEYMAEKTGDYLAQPVYQHYGQFQDTVYLLADDAYLVAIDAHDNGQIWYDRPTGSFDGGENLASPLVTTDGFVYVHRDNNVLYKYLEVTQSDGSRAPVEVWATDLSSGQFNDVVVLCNLYYDEVNELVYAAPSSESFPALTAIYCVDAETGGVLWTRTMASPVYSLTTRLDEDGVVVHYSQYGSAYTALALLDTDGNFDGNFSISLGPTDYRDVPCLMTRGSSGYLLASDRYLYLFDREFDAIDIAVVPDLDSDSETFEYFSNSGCLDANGFYFVGVDTYSGERPSDPDTLDRSTSTGRIALFYLDEGAQDPLAWIATSSEDFGTATGRGFLRDSALGSHEFATDSFLSLSHSGYLYVSQPLETGSGLHGSISIYRYSILDNNVLTRIQGGGALPDSAFTSSPIVGRNRDIIHIGDIAAYTWR